MSRIIRFRQRVKRLIKNHSATRYYLWCIRWLIYDKFHGTIIDRLYWAFTDKWLDWPDKAYPMKYNKKTESFDRFYAWGTIKKMRSFRRREKDLG